jgi:hypothetical protein
VCVCVCVCACVCAHACVPTWCVYVCMVVYIYVCMYVYIYKFRQVGAALDEDGGVMAHALVHVCACVCVRIHMQYAVCIRF